MPTGYTADVQDGKITDFAEFATQCARAFGALVEMRDEPMSAAIPDSFEPSNYHQERIAEAKDQLAKLKAMTPVEVAEAAGREHEKRMSEWRESLKRIDQTKSRYTTMLEKVRNWKPPTPDHVGLKDFMISQLTESIGWDCNTTYCTRPEKQSQQEWLLLQIECAARDVEYHTTAYQEEVECANGRSKWVRDLKDSLK